VARLVIRFSSLGDIALTGAVTGGLGPVIYLTQPAYADLAARLPGVERVLCWGKAGLMAELRSLPIDEIIDLHASSRSRWLCLQLGRPLRRVQRWDLSRRARVWFKWSGSVPNMLQRYAEAAGVPARPAPWICLPERRPAARLALLPGAAWATKRWPAERWAALGRRWPAGVVVMGGPGELGLVRAIAEAIGSRAEALAESGVERSLQALCDVRVAVGGDSGLLHICGGAGIPVVGLFGPTTSTDGYWVHRGQALELPLDCRPCSRHGSARCPVGDHACMEGLGVDAVWAAVQAELDR
jgi:heptosyltransferase-2